VRFDWSFSGGVLWGEEKADVVEHMRGYALPQSFLQNFGDNNFGLWQPISDAAEYHRRKDTVTPNASATLGVSYRVQGLKLGAGYRWERYFDVIDGGYRERKSYDRTMDGPYFKFAISFGG
jgi:hypothetical protein